MTWVDKGHDRGSKAQRGQAVQSMHTYRNTHTHTCTLYAGRAKDKVNFELARRGLVRYLRLQQLLLPRRHRIPKRESEKKTRRGQRKKNSLPLLLFFIYFLFFFKYTSIKKYFYSCARDAVERAALETSFLSVSLSHLLSHSLFVLIHCTNKSQL